MMGREREWERERKRERETKKKREKNRTHSGGGDGGGRRHGRQRRAVAEAPTNGAGLGRGRRLVHDLNSEVSRGLSGDARAARGNEAARAHVLQLHPGAEGERLVGVRRRREVRRAPEDEGAMLERVRRGGVVRRRQVLQLGLRDAAAADEALRRALALQRHNVAEANGGRGGKHGVEVGSFVKCFVVI